MRLTPFSKVLVTLIVLGAVGAGAYKQGFFEKIAPSAKGGAKSNIPPEARAQMFRDAAAKLPVGRVGTPDEIAEHYLAFMRGGYVTGQILIVDGGHMLV